MQALYTSARCICCSSLGYWRCACRMHLPIAASLAALSCAEADDAKPAMESTTGSARRYAFVCFRVLLLDSFLAVCAIRHNQRVVPRRADTQRPRIRSPGRARSKRRAAETHDDSRRFDRSNCIRSPPAGQDLQDINLPPTRANGVVASQRPQAWFSGNAMHLARRRLFYLAACAAALPAGARIARAQSYPTRPVRLIVGLAAGGGQDIVARLMGQWLAERLGRQFIVENRPGASGNLALEAVANAPPDGYTLALLGVNNAINASLYNKPGFEFLRDIAPVGAVMRVPLVMVVNPSFPATTVPPFIGYGKANPGKITMGSGGVGTSIHVSGELFKLMTGIDMLHVPYRGGALALNDLIGGQLQVMFDTMPESIGFIRAGTLRPLAVTT